MLEATTEDLGIMDAVLRTDGKGLPFLHIKAGGSVCPPSYYTLDNQMHYIYQEGRTVFKYAVANMSDACEAVIERNHLNKNDIVSFDNNSLLLLPAVISPFYINSSPGKSCSECCKNYIISFFEFILEIPKAEWESTGTGVLHKCYTWISRTNYNNWSHIMYTI